MGRVRPAEQTKLVVPAPSRRPLSLWLQKITVLSLSLLFVLGALEVGFRLLGYEPLSQVYSKPEAFWQYDALLGWSLEPGAEGEFVGPRPFPTQFRASVRINSAGLRGGEITPPPAGGRRVLLLGDSQAAGFEVDEEQTYGALTEQQLAEAIAAPVQVINAAVRGYGTDQAYLQYRERVSSLDADVVVYHATANDPEDNTTLHRMRRPFGKPAFALQDDGSLDLVGQPVPEYSLCSAYRLDATSSIVRMDTGRARAFCWLQTNLADHSALFSFVTLRLQQNPGLVGLLYGLGTPEGQAAPVLGGPADPAAARTAPPAAGSAPQPAATPVAGPAPAPAAPADHRSQVTSALIRELASRVRADGARFVLLIEQADLRGLDVAAFERDGIDIVHLDEALGPDPASVRFANDGHLNQAGHQRVADALTRSLTGMLGR